jgi:hypothetical protein
MALHADFTTKNFNAGQETNKKFNIINVNVMLDIISEDTRKK